LFYIFWYVKNRKFEVVKSVSIITIDYYSSVLFDYSKICHDILSTLHGQVNIFLSLTATLLPS